MAESFHELTRDFPPERLAQIEAKAQELRSVIASRPRFLWHVVRTTGQDKQAVDSLMLRKYRVYWPNYARNIRLRGGQSRTVTKSVFPGYLFVLPHRNGWEQLRESPGVLGLMRINDRFVCMWDDDPDFRRIEDVEKEMRQKPKKTLNYRLNQRVRLTKGPFIELWGNIAALDDSGRVDVLIELLKRKVRVSTSVNLIESCLAPPGS